MTTKRREALTATALLAAIAGATLTQVLDRPSPQPSSAGACLPHSCARPGGPPPRLTVQATAEGAPMRADTGPRRR